MKSNGKKSERRLDHSSDIIEFDERWERRSEPFLPLRFTDSCIKIKPLLIGHLFSHMLTN